jgi:site-specific DNA-methyltransferase (adenine-specific)
MCIKLHGLSKTRLVLDSFMGLGNTALACVNLGISCIGYELDPEYFKVSCETVKKALVPDENLRLF